MEYGAQFLRHGPRRAVAYFASVNGDHRHDERGRPGNEGLPRPIRFLKAECAFLKTESLRCHDVDERGSGNAAQNRLIDIARDDRSGFINDPGVRGGAFVDHAVGVGKPCFISPLLLRSLTRQHIREKRNGFDIHPFPAQIGRRYDANALARGRVAFFGDRLGAL